MKEQGAPIVYSKLRQSYYYERQGGFNSAVYKYEYDG